MQLAGLACGWERVHFGAAFHPAPGRGRGFACGGGRGHTTGRALVRGARGSTRLLETLRAGVGADAPGHAGGARDGLIRRRLQRDHVCRGMQGYMRGSRAVCEVLTPAAACAQRLTCIAPRLEQPPTGPVRVLSLGRSAWGVRDSSQGGVVGQPG